MYDQVFASDVVRNHQAAAGAIGKTKQMSDEQFLAEPRRPYSGAGMGAIGNSIQRHCRTAVTACAWRAAARPRKGPSAALNASRSTMMARRQAWAAGH